MISSAPAKLALTPPMGWMSWEIFRCDIDCATDPENCISEGLYKAQADAMVSGGFAAMGYSSIHMDDCWEQKDPPRDPTTNELRADPKRFPSGMKALGDYYHARNLSFAAYTAESTSTCGGYPASAKYEQLDAKTFASWGVDYMKVDGCGPTEYYPHGYAAMGKALQESGRDIVYSCSWPAYTGTNESTKPFQTYIDDGCHLWRNYADIQCSWDSLVGIIDHWGEYGAALQPWAGPDGPHGGHWHDMDMLLIGALGKDGQPCITDDEARTQMAIWAISAAPLIMGNDMRRVGAAAKAILFNKHAVAVSQDPRGKMGIRLAGAGDDTRQVWARELSPAAAPAAAARARTAVALFHRGVAGSPSGGAADISVRLAELPGFEAGGCADVLDVWSGATARAQRGTYTARRVPLHGSAFVVFEAVACPVEQQQQQQQQQQEGRQQQQEGRQQPAVEAAQEVPPPPPGLNGTTVFEAGLGGVANYRIPAVVQAAGGVLVAFAEARDGGDASASRIAVRTSADDGASWSAVGFVAGAVDSPAARAACSATDPSNRTACRVGNPAAVYDAAAGAVVLLYVQRGFGGGEDALGNGLVVSRDGGRSWSAPRDVSAGFGAAAGAMPGPGTALRLSGGTHDGRLLVASHKGAYARDYVTVSDDGGASWRTVNASFARMDEAALTQLPNGSVLLNMRHQQSPAKGRAVARSDDGGETWGALGYDAALISPVCQASIVSFGGATYFSNPASTSGRSHLTIRKSTDSAASWGGGALLVQQAGSAGYSCLVKGALRDHPHDGGILYEATDGTIKFARFPLSLQA